jgi:2-C-methyl-D-erythritol 4-phosphate cytidylyltransferase
VKVSILLLASGRGERFGGDVPKVYRELAGRPILQWSAERLALAMRGVPHEILLAVHPEHRQRWLAPLLPALEAAGIRQVVDGGERRQDSMRRALAAADAASTIVMIHDAARPAFPIAAARELLDRAETVGAALLAVPVQDSLKEVDDRRRVARSLDRSRVWLAQTPQAIRRDRLEAALARADADRFVATDDVGLVEHDGGAVAVVPGSPDNAKITLPGDLERIAQTLLRDEADA